MATPRARLRGQADRLTYLGLAALCYIPLLFTGRGRVAADTREALYLDPGAFLSHVLSMWDPSRDLGTVTHQNIDLVFPAGVYYWATHALGIPYWFAQRVWLGSILFAAGLGVLFLARSLRWRGIGPVVAAVLYAMSPYIIQYANRTSVLLLPWAALPWLIALTERSLRTKGWRQPALFALVVAFIASNATSVVLLMVGPGLWIAYSVWVVRETELRDALRVLGRISLLTVATSLWWVVALLMEGRYGLPLLQYTETIKQVATTASATEILRGLGYWVPYLVQGPFPEVSGAHIYLRDLPVIFVEFCLVLVALLGAVAIRWRHRIFFVALVVVGVVIGIGAYPPTDPSPLGSLFLDEARASGVGLALRSTARAGPLAILGLACLLGAFVDALRARLPRGALAFGGVVTLVAIVLAPSIAGAELVDPLYSRAENIPSYWAQALAYVDAHAGASRLVELPGSRYAAYDWGNTYEPISNDILRTPTAWREQVPYGGTGTVNLLVALDNLIQEQVHDKGLREQTLDPAALAPLARVMGASQLLFRNDLDIKRYGTVPPSATQGILDQHPAGLGEPVGFGPTITSNGVSMPALEVVPVQDPQPLVQAVPITGTVLLDGDGDGLVDAAGAGALDGRAPVLYAASTADQPALLQRVVANGARIVLTDTNRRRVHRWRTVVDTTGITLRADQNPAAANGGPGGEAPLDVFPGTGSSWQSVLEQSGMKVAASAYGDAERFQNGHQPAAAVDGDPTTTWEAGQAVGGIGDWLSVSLDRPLTTDHISISTTAYPSSVTAVDIQFDNGKPMRFALDPAQSRTPASEALHFPRRTFSKIKVTLAEQQTPPGLDGSALGIAALGLDGRTLESQVRLPTALVRRLGASSLDDALSIVLTRERGAARQPRVTQEERTIARQFTLPTARDFAVGGEARSRTKGPVTGSADLGVCRSDLVTVDGQPVPVEVTDPNPGAAVGPNAIPELAVRGCGAPLHLAAGTHVLRTAAGTGLAVDQLLLASDPGGAAAVVGADGKPVLPAPPEPLPAVVHHDSSSSIDATVHGIHGPTWLMLRESLNSGWNASAAKGIDPQGPVLLNGFANGWLVPGTSPATNTFALRWTPQRVMDVALILSALGVAAALALAIRGRRWRAASGDPPALLLDAPWADRPPASTRRVAAVAITIGVVSALVIDPLWGLAAGVLVVAGGRWRHGHALLTGLTLGGFTAAYASVFVDQVSRRTLPPDAAFGQLVTAHRIAMVALALFAADTLLVVGRRLGPARDPFAPLASRRDAGGPPSPGADEEPVPLPAPPSADRRRFVWACGAGVVPAFLLFLWMITAGTFDVFAAHLTADFYDGQAHALLGGHLALPPGLLGIEAFVVDGKEYMYQGPTPALLRLPVALFTHSLDGRLTIVSMLAAFVLAAVAVGWITWQVRALVRGAAPVGRGETVALAGYMFVATGGSVLLFTAGQVSVYHESALWGAALALAALGTILRYLSVPRRWMLAAASVLVLLAMWSRASVGLGALVALALVAGAELVARLRAARGHREWGWAVGLRPTGAATTRRAIALIAACAMPAVLYVGLNEVKFHTAFSVPWEQQVYTALSTNRQDFLARNNGTFFGAQFVPTTAVEYLRPDAVTFQRAFPWVGFRYGLVGSEEGYRNVRFDKIDVTGSVPTSFPLLTALSLVGAGAVIVARRRAPALRRLRAPLVGAIVGGSTIFGFGFIAERYLSDLSPVLALAGAAGFAVTARALGARTFPWRRVAIGALIALGVFGSWVVFAQTLWFQRVFASPPDESATQAFVRTQVDLASHYAHGSVLPVTAGNRLPARGSPGELFVVGDCAGLYVSDGSLVDAVQPTNWKPVQRTEQVGAYHADITFPRRPAGAEEPLLGGGSPGHADLVTLRYLGDDTVEFVHRADGDEQASRPLHLTPGRRYDVQLSADPQIHQVAVTLDGNPELLAPFAGDAPLRLGVNPADDSTGARFGGEIRRLPESDALCRTVRSRAGLGGATGQAEGVSSKRNW